MPEEKQLFELSDLGIKTTIANDISVAFVEESIFGQFIGTGNNAPIKTQDESENIGGIADVRLKGHLRDGGVEGNQDFDENEGELSNLYMRVPLESFGNSVKSGEKIKIKSQVKFISFRDDAKDSLGEWGVDKLDRRIMSRAAYDATSIICAGKADTMDTSTLTSSSYATVQDIVNAVAVAKSTENPDGSSKPKVTPYKTIMQKDAHGVSIKRKIYIMFVGEATAYNLKQDPEWKVKQQEASDTGLASNLFTGQLGVIDDCILIQVSNESKTYAGIYTSKKTGEGGESFANYAGANDAEMEINILMGATAMVMPMDDGFNYYEDTYDYKKKAKVGIDRECAIQKAKFMGNTAKEKEDIHHNKDFSLLVVIASAKKNQ